jgi:hypothetical protein
MSGDWWRLHQVRGVCGGSPKNHRFTRLSHKVTPKAGCSYQAKTGLIGLENRSDRFEVAGRQKLRGGGHASGSQGLRRCYAKCGPRAFVRWCYKDKFPKCLWWACILVLALGAF